MSTLIYNECEAVMLNATFKANKRSSSSIKCKCIDLEKDFECTTKTNNGNLIFYNCKLFS